MRKKEKQITEKSQIEAIIKRSTICRLAMCFGNLPYIVPLCFGYHADTLYFHSADEGKKLDILKENPNVCFELECDTELVKAADACNWSMKYCSVIGFGEAFFVTHQEERQKALDCIMRQYSDKNWEFNPKMLEKTLIFKVTIHQMTGKQSS